MTYIQEDYILRMIQMMGELIAAALNLKRSGALNAADETLSDALLTVMPDQADIITLVDAKTAVSLLADPRLINGYIEILLEHANIKLRLDALEASEALQRRALQLFLTAHRNPLNFTPETFLLQGRLAGLELHLLLEDDEYEQWVALERSMDRLSR